MKILLLVAVLLTLGIGSPSKAEDSHEDPDVKWTKVNGDFRENFNSYVNRHLDI